MKILIGRAERGAGHANMLIVTPSSVAHGKDSDNVCALVSGSVVA